MIRLLALLSLLLGLTAFAQGANEQQQCEMKCAEAMNVCMQPCLGSNPKDSMSGDKKDKTMACVKACSTGQKPCMHACKKKK